MATSHCGVDATGEGALLLSLLLLLLLLHTLPLLRVRALVVGTRCCWGSHARLMQARLVHVQVGKVFFHMVWEGLAGVRISLSERGGRSEGTGLAAADMVFSIIIWQVLCTVDYGQ